jgi:hypothetical protein
MINFSVERATSRSHRHGSSQTERKDIMSERLSSEITYHTIGPKVPSRINCSLGRSSKILPARPATNCARAAAHTPGLDDLGCTEKVHSTPRWRGEARASSGQQPRRISVAAPRSRELRNATRESAAD